MCTPGHPCPGAEDGEDEMKASAKAGMLAGILMALFGAVKDDKTDKEEKTLSSGGKLAAMLALMEIRRRTAVLVKEKKEREEKGVTLSAKSEHELVREILGLMRLANTLKDSIGESDEDKPHSSAAFQKLLVASVMAQKGGIAANDPARDDFMANATNSPEKTSDLIKAIFTLMESKPVKINGKSNYDAAEAAFIAKMRGFGILKDTDVVRKLDRVKGDNDGVEIFLEDGNEIELTVFDFGNGKFALLGSTSKRKEKDHA